MSGAARGVCRKYAEVVQRFAENPGFCAAIRRDLARLSTDPPRRFAHCDSEGRRGQAMPARYLNFRGIPSVIAAVCA